MLYEVTGLVLIDICLHLLTLNLKTQSLVHLTKEFKIRNIIYIFIMKGSTSETSLVSSGAPQGSVMRPLLLLV